MKNYFKTTIFILILLIIVFFLNNLFTPVGTYEGGWYASGAMQDMYKQKKNTIDVLYVGDSNIYAGVSPLDIYNLNGVTGFSASTPAQDVNGSYYIIREFFKRQNPKLVMLETGEFFTEMNHVSELGKRSEIDFMKLGINKLELINDDDFNFSNYEKLTFIFPILKFHTRYKKITEFDIRKLFLKNEMSYKGYLYDKEVKKYEKKDNELKENNLEIPNYVCKKVDLLKDFCIKNNSELILLTMPNTDKLENKKHEILTNFGKEKDLKYIDLNLENENPINWETDSQDGGEHLNIYGAKKVAAYISKFINENFEIQSKKEDEKYKIWNENLAVYLNKDDKTR